jgi:hypothetical protein
MTGDEARNEIEELKKRTEKLRPKYAEMTLRGFLENTPPDTYVSVVDLKFGTDGRYIETPDIMLYCENTDCCGERNFKCGSSLFVDSTWRYEFLTYTCRNCASRVAKFAIAFLWTDRPSTTSAGRATCIKLGQVPAFGPQTPARLITLIGPDREIFLQGRRAESRGLGIGAFAYYRRVVENQKKRIIAEIAKVAKLLGANTETNALFVAAMNETRFSESLAMVKDVIPQTLMIGGQNPLSLLHTALSRGLHNPEMTDAHCLQLAQGIRTILAELAERASEALKNDKEIQSAISLLMAVPSGPKAKLERIEAQAGTIQPKDKASN